MSDSNDKQNQTNTSIQSQQTTSEAEDAIIIDNDDTATTRETQPKQPRSAGNKLLWLVTWVNLLGLTAIGAAGYWYWTHVQHTLATEESTLIAMQQGFEQQIRAIDERANNLTQSQNSLTSSLNTLREDILQNSQMNDALQQKLAELSGRRPSDWLIAEAEYLVNMASRKLYLEDDVRTSQMLLAEADSRLQDLNDPALFPIRNLIAADIAALKQVNNVSEISISLSLGGLLPQVAKLPMRTLRLPEPPPESETTPSSDVNDWQENLKRTWRGIVGDFIKVTPIDAPIEPYLAERQQWLIEQQLTHALSRAQTAALERHTAVFTQSLQEAVSIIGEHYDTQAPSVDQFLGALEQLLNTNFEKVYPQELKSRIALQQVINQRIEALFNNNGNSL